MYCHQNINLGHAELYFLQGPGLSRYGNVHVKIHVSQLKFINVASDWLAAHLPANQEGRHVRKSMCTCWAGENQQWAPSISVSWDWVNCDECDSPAVWCISRHCSVPLPRKSLTWIPCTAEYWLTTWKRHIYMLWIRSLPQTFQRTIFCLLSNDLHISKQITLMHNHINMYQIFSMDWVK